MAFNKNSDKETEFGIIRHNFKDRESRDGFREPREGFERRDGFKSRDNFKTSRQLRKARWLYPP